MTRCLAILLYHNHWHLQPEMDSSYESTSQTHAKMQFKDDYLSKKNFEI